jgi:hypothetical protein
MSITTQSLIAETGRENGPDFVLTPLFNPINGGAITANSNITEVLNVIAYLCNPDAQIGGNGPLPRTDAVIDTNQSVQGIVGLHNPNGEYAANDGAGASNNSLWLDADLGGMQMSHQMIDLDSFQVPAGGYTANYIPQGILAREPQQIPNPLGTAHRAIQIAGPAAAGALPADITTELSCAVKQMITILIKTRAIFGPKGWTELFSRVKGGGSSRSKNAKRTHRHRRRYSSKQY